MKMKFVPLLILLPLLALPLAGQQVRFDALEKDLGDIKPLSSASAEYIVYNDGPGTLLLADPKPSCGCTATILDRHELAAGDSAVIGVRFQAAPGMMGPMSKTISINAREDGGERYLGTLRVNVRIVGSVIYEPGMLRFETAIGDTMQLELTLISNTDRDVHIENVSASLLAYVDTTEGNTYHVDAVQTRPFTNYDLRVTEQGIPPGDSTTVILTVRPLAKGQINGSLRIPIPDGELRVPVVGVILRTRGP